MVARTVYGVQCYAGTAGALVKGRLWHFGYEDEARAAGEMLEGRVAGWVMFSVRGDPEFGAWDEPVVLETYGALPDEALGAAA
jgi:hypothetical protein